jgi:chemotaxis protein histidine kinase CheA
MPSLRDYFLSEAGACLGRLGELLRADTVDRYAELHRLARSLRGTAQIARHDRASRAARELETAARNLETGTLPWSDDVRARISSTIHDLGVIIAEAESDDKLEQRVLAITERWRGAMPAAPAQQPADEGAAPAERERREFFTFAAREVAGIGETMDHSIDALGSNPMDREALKAILRRQRVLLGSARLEDIPPVAQTLRAVEDISRIIAKMNVAIKDEWLEVFRCARQVLSAAHEALDNAQDPPETKQLRRLRTYREELLERYGDGEAVSAAAPASDGLVQALTGETAEEKTSDTTAPAEKPAAPAAPAIQPNAPSSEVAIHALLYDGEAALRRALELRSRVERAVEHDPDALAAIDEVFDLIRLALR